MNKFADTLDRAADTWMEPLRDMPRIEQITMPNYLVAEALRAVARAARDSDGERRDQ